MELYPPSSFSGKGQIIARTEALQGSNQNTAGPSVPVAEPFKPPLQTNWIIKVTQQFLLCTFAYTLVPTFFSLLLLIVLFFSTCIALTHHPPPPPLLAALPLPQWWGQGACPLQPIHSEWQTPTQLCRRQTHIEGRIRVWKGCGKKRKMTYTKSNEG